MIIGIFYIFTALVFVVALYTTDSTGAKPNANILLGVTLPYRALTDDAVAGIVQKYRKSYSLVALSALILAAPFVVIAEYVSVSIVYLTVWITAFLCVNQTVVNTYFNKLYALKCKNGWWVGTPGIVSVDTEVSRLKNRFSVTKKWFVIPACISAIPLATDLADNGQKVFSIPVALCGAVTLAVCFFASIIYGRDRTVAYSDDTDVNIALNHAYKYEWSKCFVILAALSSTLFVILSHFLLNIDTDSAVLVCGIPVLSVITAAPIFIAYNNIRNTRNRLLRLTHITVYADDDQYWRSGFYNNPNDGRTMVEKRIGYGMTVNMAKTGGKICVALPFCIIPLMIGLAVFLSPLDFGDVSLAVSGRMITVKAPMYEYALSANDVKAVTLIDDFPAAGKINGGDSARFLTGRFNVKGYGASNVYIFRNVSPYVAVELADGGWLFLNGSTNERTKAFHDSFAAFAGSHS